VKDMIDIARQQRLERRQAKRREARAARRVLTKAMTGTKLAMVYESWGVDALTAEEFAIQAAKLMGPNQVMALALLLERKPA
jgi:hypothetical protein